MSPHPEIARLEAIAFRSWPSAEVQTHRGMFLRHTGGESRRANSAALHACDAGLDAGEAIDVAERFYRERGVAPQFQLGPTAPPGFDAALEARGYVVAAPVWVQTASIGEVLRRCAAPRAGATSEVLAAPDDAWIDIEVTRGRYSDIRETFLGLLTALAPRAAFGLARVDGAPAGACFAAHDEDVLVLAAMRTLAEARRRGAAVALLDAVASWGRARGATLAYLQVDRENTPATSLYAAAGFATLYGYHYRERS